MFSFTARYPAILLILILIISAAVSIYFYRNSPLSRLRKYSLIGLKTLAIFLVIMLFIEPSIEALIDTHSDSKNLVLIDNSRSNLLTALSNEGKDSQIRRIAAEEFLNNSSNRIFTFSSRESSLKQFTDPDSLEFEGYETNLAGALSNLKRSLIEESISGITVVSDGVFNAGGNPLYSARLFQCPVLTFAIGDSAQKKDAVLRSVFYEKKAFTQTDNVIKAVINTHFLSSATALVSLYREGTLINSSAIPINSDSQTDEVNFSVREPDPGKVKYSIQITEYAGEINYLNNRAQILVDYIDNKTNILLISGGPGYDNALIQNILRRISNYNLTVRTVRNPNEFYEGNIDLATIGEQSLIFLLGFPVAAFSSEITGTIAAKVIDSKIPVLFFAQKNTDYKKLEAFDGQIPFYAARTNSIETQLSPQPVSSAENILKDIEKEISSSPQIFRNVYAITQKPGSITLLTDKSTGEPVLITNRSEKTKSTAFLGYGLWRWGLNEKQTQAKTLERFITKCVDLTLIKEKKTKLRISAAKDIFDLAEDIRLYAEVYDEEHRFTRNAKVTVNILQNGNIISKDILFTTGEDKYTASLPALPIGDYQIEAEAELSGSLYAKDETRFLVDSVNTEFLVTKSDFNSLRELSQNTGGRCFSPEAGLNSIAEEIDALLSSETSSPKVARITFKLWENKYWMLLIIIVFSVEWAFRKRSNIP